MQLFGWGIEVGRRLPGSRARWATSANSTRSSRSIATRSATHRVAASFEVAQGFGDDETGVGSNL